MSRSSAPTFAQGRATQQASRRVSKSSNLYRGDFLVGWYVRDAPDFENWRLLQQEHQRALALQGWAQLVAHHQRTREYAAALAANQQRLALDPLNEAAHQQQIQLYLVNGQRTEALRQYRRCEELLRAELGVAPADATVTLYRLAQQTATPTAERASPPFPAQPEPAASLNPAAGPFFQPPGLVGVLYDRDAQIERGVQRLLTQDIRLLTLTGLGGVGKTALAQAIGARLAGVLRHGVCFVALAGVEPSATSAATRQAVRLSLTTALGIGDDQTETLTALQKFLRDKELLLILDGCEQLVDALTWLPKLLAAAPQVRILATAREPLGLAEEAVEVIQGLSVPAEQASLADLAQHPAVLFFVACAQHAQPGFELTAKNGPAIAHICRLVAGLPLAIELAAQWAPLYTPAEIAAAAERALSFLHAAFLDLPERQRNLSVLLHQTWRTLTAEEQRSLCQLAVCVGGFSRAAAEQIAHTSPSSLLALLRRGLLRHQPNDRYDIHPLLQRYTYELRQDDAAETAATCDRHCIYYLTYGAQLVPELWQRPADHTVFAAMDADLGNFRAAWDWLSRPDLGAATLAQLDAVAVPCLTALTLFFSKSARYREGLIFFQRVGAALQERQASAPQNPRLTDLMGHVWLKTGELQLQLGQWAEARAELERGLAQVAQAPTAHVYERAQGQAFLAACLLELGEEVAAEAFDPRRARSTAHAR